MPVLRASDTATTLTIEGEERQYYRIVTPGIDAAHDIDAIVLRRTLPGIGTKVRPTNVTAVVVFRFVHSTAPTTNPDIFAEIIVLHNGPHGGFDQLPLGFPTANAGYSLGNVYVNGVIQSIVTDE